MDTTLATIESVIGTPKSGGLQVSKPRRIYIRSRKTGHVREVVSSRYPRVIREVRSGRSVVRCRQLSEFRWAIECLTKSKGLETKIYSTYEKAMKAFKYLRVTAK